MTSFIHPGNSPAAIVRRYSFLSGNVMFVMISDPCSVNSELYPTGLKLPSTFRRCISCNAACRRWAVNKYGCYTNKLSVQHGQGSKTSDNTWNTNEDSTSIFTCMKTPFTHSYAKCPALSLVVDRITLASLCLTADMCRRDTQSSHSKPALPCFRFARFTTACWHFLKQFFKQIVLFLDHLTRKKKAPWSLENWGNIQWHTHFHITKYPVTHTLSHHKRLEYLAHWLWEHQISQKMLVLFLG